MTEGPSVRAKHIARRRGYAPPLAWENIDDPDEVSLTQFLRDWDEARAINYKIKERERSKGRSHKKKAA